MKEKSKKKKMVWQQYIAVIFFMLVGAVCGVLMVKFIETTGGGMTLTQQILSLAGLLLAMYVSMFVQIVIHETGHLVFGLLSGYSFSSFRIMSFMWVKENEKLKFRRFSLAGTGGQCLMVPPDMKDGKLPVGIYNMGGSLMNIISSGLFIMLYFMLKDVPVLSVILLMLAIIGVAFAAMNGIPMRMGTVDNDGYNALSLSRDKGALRSFWVQMKANEQISKGVRLKDMPDDWFTVPSDEDMKNSMIAVMGVFSCNRLMDEQKFHEADSLMAHLLEIESGIVGLYRSLMICDRMYCELISENRREVLDGMITKEQVKFMKSMKKYPSVLRTQYVYALLCDKDAQKADKIKAQFENCARTYPYPNDIQSERELMALAEEILENTAEVKA